MDLTTALQQVGLDGWIGWVVLGFTVLSTVASAVSAAFPDSKLGSVLAPIINAIGLNIGQAKNSSEE